MADQQKKPEDDEFGFGQYMTPPPGNAVTADTPTASTTDPRLAVTDQGGGQITDTTTDTVDPALEGTDKDQGQTRTQPEFDYETDYTKPPPSFGDGSGGGIDTPARQSSALGHELDDYARDWLKSPSRWDTDLIQNSMDVIRNDMDRIRSESSQGLRAEMASRGLLDSSAGMEFYGDQNARLYELEGARRNDLTREAANTYGADRSAAFGAGQRREEFGESQYQFDVDTQIRNRALELQKLGMDQDQAYRYARMEQDSQQFGVSSDLQRRALELERSGLDSRDAYNQARLEEDRRQFNINARQNLLFNNDKWPEMDDDDKDAWDEFMKQYGGI
jgi:hypothetical protein